MIIHIFVRMVNIGIYNFAGSVLYYYIGRLAAAHNGDDVYGLTCTQCCNDEDTYYFVSLSWAVAMQ